MQMVPLPRYLAEVVALLPAMRAVLDAATLGVVVAFYRRVAGLQLALESVEYRGDMVVEFTASECRRSSQRGIGAHGVSPGFQ